MKLSRVFVIVLMPILTSCAPRQAANRYEPAFNYLATGNAAAGRVAFAELKCGTCHRVVGDIAFQSAVMEGPDLGAAQAGHSHNGIAESIAMPSHVMPSDTGTVSAVSPMGDYSNVMTIGQLRDLVAFVKALPE